MIFVFRSAKLLTIFQTANSPAGKSSPGASPRCRPSAPEMPLLRLFYEEAAYARPLSPPRHRSARHGGVNRDHEVSDLSRLASSGLPPSPSRRSHHPCVGLYPRCSRSFAPAGLTSSEPRSGRSTGNRGSERSGGPGYSRSPPRSAEPPEGARSAAWRQRRHHHRRVAVASFQPVCCRPAPAVASRMEHHSVPSLPAVVGDLVTSVNPAMAGVAAPWWGHSATTLGLFVDEPQGQGSMLTVRAADGRGLRARDGLWRCRRPRGASDRDLRGAPGCNGSPHRQCKSAVSDNP